MARSPRQIDERFSHFCRTGDPGALGEVFDATARELLHVALWLAGNRADAEDLLQRTFLLAIETRGKFEAGRPAVPWLLGLLAHEARRLRRERARRAPPSMPVADGNDPEAAAATAELRAAVHAVRAQLAIPYQDVLTLHLEQGMNSKEIAERLGRPAGTVRTQLVRALELLRQRLPAGFIAGFAPFASDAGTLAMTKAAVLAAAHGAVPIAAAASAGVTATVVTGGVLVSKQLQLAVPVLALLLGVATWFVWPAATEQPAAAAQPMAMVADLDRSTTGSQQATATPTTQPERQTIASPSPDETEPGFASLRVVMHWQHDGSPASHLGVTAYDERNSERGCRDAVTDADGVAILRHLAPGTWQIQSDYVVRKPALGLAAGRQQTIELLAHRQRMLQGLVVDQDQRPVAGARIWCGTEWQHGYEVDRTDAQGRFTLPLVEGQFVGARMDGFAPSYLRKLDRDDQAAEIVLALRGPGGTLRGTVLDENGAPLARAKVLVGRDENFIDTGNSRLVPPLPYVQRAEQAFTDREGRFVVAGVAPGNTEVRAWAPGLAPCLDTVLVTAHAEAVVIVRMQRAASIAGVARDDDGAPVAEAFVEAGEFSEFCYARTSTDAAGRFRLGDLGTGPVRLRVGKCTAEARTTLELAAGSITEWNPVLSLGKTIQGTVLDPEGQPMPGVVIAKYTTEEHTLWPATDAGGRFLLDHVGDAPLDLLVTSNNVPIHHVDAVAPGTRDLLIRVSAATMPSACIRGRMLDARGAAVSATLTVGTCVGGFRVGTIFHGDPASGALSTRLLPPGTYAVEIDARGFGKRPLGNMVLGRGQTLELGDFVFQRPGSAKFTLLDLQGQPMPNGLLRVSTDRGLAVCQVYIKDGSGAANELQPGRYFLTGGQGAGQASTEAHGDFVIASGTDVHVDLRMQEQAYARVRLRDVATDDLQVNVFAFTMDGHYAGGSPDWHRPTGQIRLAPGHYTLDCRADDGRSASGELTISSLDDHPEITIELPLR